MKGNNHPHHQQPSPASYTQVHKHTDTQSQTPHVFTFFAFRVFQRPQGCKKKEGVHSEGGTVKSGGVGCWAEAQEPSKK